MKTLAVSLFLLLSAVVWAAPPTVQVKEASLYSQASPTSKFLGKLPLGTVLTILSEKESWSQVKAAGLTGWIRSQSYTTKELKLQTGSQTSGASATEVSLAGRGFTEEIEKDYKRENPALDFLVLDAMEAQGIPEDELADFLKDGGSQPWGGLW